MLQHLFDGLFGKKGDAWGDPEDIPKLSGEMGGSYSSDPKTGGIDPFRTSLDDQRATEITEGKRRQGGLLNFADMKDQVTLAERDAAGEGIRSSIVGMGMGKGQINDTFGKMSADQGGNIPQAPQNSLPSGGGGGTSIPSDKRSKGIGGMADKAVEKFLQKLDPKLYTYKDPSFSPVPEDFDEPQLGILAQDVQKTPVGKSLIEKDPKNGLLQVKVLPMVSALAASVAHLNKKLEKLSGK